MIINTCFRFLCSWILSFKLPAVVGKHCWTPCSFVAFSMVEISWWNIHYHANHWRLEVCWGKKKKSRRLWRKCSCRHVASPISEGLEHIFNKCLLAEWLTLANKVVNNYFKRFASSSFSPLSNVSTFLFFIRSFLLDSLICGNFFCGNWKTFPLLSTPLKKFFIIPSYLCNGGKNIFFGWTSSSFLKFFCPGSYCLRLDHSFREKWRSFAWLSHSHKE